MCVSVLVRVVVWCILVWWCSCWGSMNRLFSVVRVSVRLFGLGMLWRLMLLRLLLRLLLWLIDVKFSRLCLDWVVIRYLCWF